MSQRNLFKHYASIGAIKYPLLLKKSQMSFDEWMSLSSSKRYQLKKTYKKFNIDIPTENEY
jgi:hypothetical protein